MQTKPIFFDCDLGRFQLVVATQQELSINAATSCQLCGFCLDDGCVAIERDCDCSVYDDIVRERDPFASCHWRKVLPTSKSANTPRAERGTIEKEVH